MNEELRIIISAATSAAKKNLAEIRKELKDIGEAAAESSKPIDQAMQGIRKSTLAAIGGIAALTTAVVTLGHRSLEFQKIQGQLIAGFQSVGLSAKQAGTTYKELFGFLGEADTAAETANLLARLTQEEANLAEWTKILQGVFATFPDSLPIEGLAESINHTVKMGKVQGNLADALEWSGVSVDAFNAKLESTISLSEREAMIRGTLNSLYGQASAIYGQANQALIAYNQSQVAVDQALANATQYVIPLMTALNNLAATLLAVLKPAFEVVASVIIIFVQWIIAAIKAIGTFFGVFSGKGTKSTEKVSSTLKSVSVGTGNVASGANKVGKAFDNAAKSAEKLRRQTMGFDELNIIQPQQSASASGGAGSGIGGGGVGAIDIPEISIPEVSEIDLPGLEEFEEKVEQVRKILIPVLTLVGAVTAGLMLWKITDFISELINLNKFVTLGNDLLKRVGKEGFEAAFGEGSAAKITTAQDRIKSMLGHLKTFGGAVLIVAGAIALVTGYTDAWVNGIDWKNFALIIGGIAAIVGGVALAFGPMAAAIALVVGGIVAMVIGVKDLITNGYSMQAVLMVAAGAIAVVVGAIWAFNAALLANPITWIIVAIMALVAVFVILWNECEAFRNFWIDLWEKAKVLFAAFIDSCQPAIDAFVKMFRELWGMLKEIWKQILGIFKDTWENIMAIWVEAEPFFKAIWEGIKFLFSGAKDVLGSFFKLAWEAIKAIWSVVVSYFAAVWNGIAGIFSVVKNVLQGNWKGAWDAIKSIVGGWNKYFQDVWSAIKKIFSAVKTFFKETFGAGWDAVKKVFSGVSTFFTNLFNTIKNIFSKIGSAIGNAVSNAFSSAINWILKKAVNLINGFIGSINTAISIINAIPGVNINKLSKLSVPQLAKGGIVDSATLAVIGERGKEAVLPLENNTGWIDTLADKLAARNSTPTRIVLSVDGRELGYAAINSINGITRQTGHLQLALV